MKGHFCLFELATFIHELGYIFNAPDHYGSEELQTPETEVLNKELKENGITTYKYDRCCIYGEEGVSTAYSKLIMCEGCQYKIHKGEMKMKLKNMMALILIPALAIVCLTSCVEKAEAPVENKEQLQTNNSETENNKTDSTESSADKTTSRGYQDYGFPFLANQDNVVSSEEAKKISVGMTYHEIANRLCSNGWQCGSGVDWVEWVLDNGEYLQVVFKEGDWRTEGANTPSSYYDLYRVATEIRFSKEALGCSRGPADGEYDPENPLDTA